jgi:translocation and assembly module TamB
MSRTGRLVRNVAIGVAGTIVIVLIAAVIVIQTGWFRGFVRERIISAVEESTGGKAEVGSFDFDLSRMRATLTGFVIHGREPAGAPPFVRIRRIVVDLRLLGGKPVGISYLGVEQPEANIVVLADGNTNVPTPKQKSQSNTSTLETVVDLAVGRFELTGGMSTFESRRQPLRVSAENLRAQLLYNIQSQTYQGQVSLQPLYVISGRETPVQFTVTVPVALQRDRIEIHNATLSTPVSAISLDGSIDNMRNPRLSTHLNGHIATADLRNAAGVQIKVNDTSLPAQVDLDANATVSNDLIRVTQLRVGLGQSNFEASGTLKDPSGNGSLRLDTRIAVAEIGRLFEVSARPGGEVRFRGTAKLDARNDYRIDGNLEANHLEFQQGTGRNAQKISGINLASAVHVDPRNAALNQLRLTAFGGGFDGDAALHDLTRYEVKGNVHNFDIQTLARTFGQKLPWAGSIQGAVGAQGDTRTAGAKSIVANARLSIVPGRNGVPVSGSLNADFNGAADNVVIPNSYIAWPHSRFTVDGSVGNATAANNAVTSRLNIAFTSRDLNDLLVAASTSGRPPVGLNQGEASFKGNVTGTVSSPRISGHLAARRFSVDGRQFSALDADMLASPSGASIQAGRLSRDPMQADFSASAGLRNWAPAQDQPVAFDVSIRNGDLADALALSGKPIDGYSGPLEANAHIRGTIGDPQGDAALQLGDGMIAGEPVEEGQVRVNLASGRVTIATAYLVAYGGSNPGRLDLSAEFQHPPGSFNTGTMHAHLQSTRIDLARIHAVEQRQPNSSGTVELNTDVNADLRESGPAGKQTSELVVTSVSADAAARGLRFEGQNYGDITATARTSGQNVNYNITSDFAGSNLRVNGSTQLVRDYPTTADINLANLTIERVLVLAKKTSIPARGILSGVVHVNGTAANPEGNADLQLSRGMLYGQQIDRMRARMTYLARSIDVPQVEIVSGPASVELNAHYDHPAGNLNEGSARFSVNSSRIDLSRVAYVQNARPGLVGSLRVSASGAANVREAEPRILLKDLNANVAATDIGAQGKKFGGLTLTANTSGGTQMNFALDSDLAAASVHGRGNLRLEGDYPVNGQLSFNNVAWTHIGDLLGTGGTAQPSFDAMTDGQIAVNGPLLKTDQLRGSFQLSRLNLTTIPRPGAGKPITIANQGPLAAVLDSGVIRIQSAHLTGPETDIQAEGTASLDGKPMNLSLNARADLGILPNFDPQIYSNGNVALAVVVRGTSSKPLMNGQVTLNNASFNYGAGAGSSGVSNGIYNANGVVALNGNTATVRNLTAESGGGKITLGGFVSYAGVLRFAVRANASNVRVPVQQGASVTTDADIRFNGTTKSSLVSGTVTIVKLSWAPQSDIGSLLSGAGPPVESPASNSTFLENIKLDIRVRTTTGTSVQTSLAQGLSADADLRVRGTATQPGILGRVTIDKGQVVFFGNTYTINTGSISFFNPIRIEPILDVSLETQAQSVDVTLHVTGPIDNLKLSYTSNPPLQFQEIVSLLASGKAPTSDPTVLANQKQQPQQSYQQMGESAILGAAVANPVSSQLQRVFGVSQFKIDPAFTSGSQVPTARLTLQQRINSNLTFTYTSALDDPNGQIIRIEWAFDPKWSAMATRDQNGLFSINFFYKRQFR